MTDKPERGLLVGIDWGSRRIFGLALLGLLVAAALWLFLRPSAQGGSGSDCGQAGSRAHLDLVEGRVIDSAGTAVADARVRVVRLRGDSLSGLGVERQVIAQAVSEHGGRFVLDVSRARRHVWIEAEANGHSTGNSYLEDFLFAERVTVVLERPARIEGRVVARASETPLVGADIEVSDGPFCYGSLATTDGTGRFVILNAPRGALTLGTAPDGYAPTVVEASFGDGVGSELVLTVSKGATVHGRVYSRDTGDPVVDAVLSSSVWPQRTVHTDREGVYALQGIPVDGDGPVGYLIVEAPAYARERVDFAESASAIRERVRLDVPLEAGVTLAGTVVTESGGPVADADVEVMSLNAEVLTQTDAQGAFALHHLRPDETLEFLGLWVSARGYYVTEYEPATATEPGVVDIGTIELVAHSMRTVAVHGVVSDHASPNAAPVVECWREVSRGRARIDTRQCDSRGRFRLRVPAEATLSLCAKSGTRRSETVNVATANTSLTLNAPLVIGD